jgi:hypothetical protein
MLRREYKYLVPNEITDQLRKELEPFVELDKYALIRPNKEYTVRSIYYDTLDLDYYNEKLDGIKNRKKLRIRGYNELGNKNIVFLEIKRKIENFIDKYRAMLNYENLDELIYSGDLNSYIIQKEADAINNARRFLYHLNRKMLKPISLVVYDREAFFSKFDSNIRITFDKNLRYCSYPSFPQLYREDILKKAMTKHFVLEIKFYKGYSEHIRNIIKKHGLLHLAVSKYQICIDVDKNITKSLNNKQFIFANPVWQEQMYCKEAV